MTCLRLDLFYHILACGSHTKGGHCIKGGPLYGVMIPEFAEEEGVSLPLLPSEVLAGILRPLTVRETIHLSCTSSIFHSLCGSDAYWHAKAQTNWPSVAASVNSRHWLQLKYGFQNYAHLLDFLESARSKARTAMWNWCVPTWFGPSPPETCDKGEWAAAPMHVRKAVHRLSKRYALDEDSWGISLRYLPRGSLVSTVPESVKGADTIPAECQWPSSLPFHRQGAHGAGVCACESEDMHTCERLRLGKPTVLLSGWLPASSGGPVSVADGADIFWGSSTQASLLHLELGFEAAACKGLTTMEACFLTDFVDDYGVLTQAGQLNIQAQLMLTQLGEIPGTGLQPCKLQLDPEAWIFCDSASEQCQLQPEWLGQLDELMSCFFTLHEPTTPLTQQTPLSRLSWALRTSNCDLHRAQLVGKAWQQRRHRTVAKWVPAAVRPLLFAAPRGVAYMSWSKLLHRCNQATAAMPSPNIETAVVPSALACADDQADEMPPELRAAISWLEQQLHSGFSEQELPREGMRAEQAQHAAEHITQSLSRAGGAQYSSVVLLSVASWLPPLLQVVHDGTELTSHLTRDAILLSLSSGSRSAQLRLKGEEYRRIHGPNTHRLLRSRLTVALNAIEEATATTEDDKPAWCWTSTWHAIRMLDRLHRRQMLPEQLHWRELAGLQDDFPVVKEAPRPTTLEIAEARARVLAAAPSTTEVEESEDEDLEDMSHMF